MTNTIYHEDSEIDVSKCSENSLTLPGSDELDFSKYWVNPRIDLEVLRGKILKEQKLKSHSIAREYDVIDINLDKPSCSTNPFQSSASRSSVHHRKKKRHKSPIRVFNKSKVKRQAQKKCPMRIAELAVPTKRHCIETWRNKSDTLPSFMVERLRQIIMDEKPILKIQDAINCFKARKRSVKSRRSSEKIRYPINVRKTNLDEIKLFSGIFGYKISRKLISPLNITLNPQLKKISEIVNDEISLTLSKGHQVKQEMSFHIQAEIADKVTIWIAQILEDASYKLILEDFQELEEEEGVVWEIIDDLVDNVVNISEPESLPNISEMISIPPTQSHLSNEIPIIKDKPSVHNAIEANQSDVVYLILKKIVANVVGDENISTESKNTLIGNETSELSDISHNVKDKTNSGTIITDGGQNKVPDIVAKEDTFIQELSVNDIKSDWRNERHIKTISTTEGKRSDSAFIKTAIKELQHTYDPIDILLDTDKDEIQSTPFTYAYDTNETINASEQDITYKPNMNISIANITKALKANINARNIEQTKHEDIFEDFVLNNSSPNNVIKGEEINNTVVKFDDTVGKNVIEVANDEEHFEKLSTDNILTKADTNDGNIEDVDNVADRSEANDLTSDDSIKKVKFSHFNIGLEGGTELNKRSNNPTTYDDSDHIYELVESDAYKTSKDVMIVKSIHFAPPNDNFLSDADEPWPNNLNLPMVKVTLSVSKSVLSLGNIIEAEEKYASPSEEKDQISFTNYKEPVINISGQQLHTVNNLLFSENKVTEHVESFLGSDDSTDTEWKSKEYRDNGDTKNDFLLFYEHPSEIPKVKLLGDSIDLNDTIDDSTVLSAHSSVILKEKHISKEKECSRDTLCLSKLAIVHTPFINILGLYTFKDIAFTNEKIVQTDRTALKNLELTEYQINKTEVRKWCQGLENVLNNLEIWSSWVENTCTYIMHFKHNEYKYPKIRKSITQKWIKLQEDVELDAALWFKLSKHLRIGLRSYRNYYENPRVYRRWYNTVIVSANEKHPKVNCACLDIHSRFEDNNQTVRQASLT